MIDDVVLREALSVVELARGEHAQADIYDDERLAFDCDCHERQAVFGGYGAHGLAQVAPLAAFAVVMHQECGHAQGAGFLF